MRRPIAWQQGAALLMGLLTLATIINSLRHDYYHDQDLRTQAATTRPVDDTSRGGRRTSDDTRPMDYYRRAICRCAGKSRYPPWLVDTSVTRVLSGYLTSQELLQAAADPRVHAIVFATDHFTLAPVSSFHPLGRRTL